MPQHRSAGSGTKFVFSIGSIAYGVKEGGFNTFLMIYYNQVLGLPALYTGLAIFLALIVDAFTDPYIGHLSDNWRSKMGRRHPFMYSAIIPMALAYALMWHPPTGLSHMQLFMFLVFTSILVRSLLTLYEVPNSAMIAELEADYDKRTSLNAMRQAFGWLGGIVLGTIAFIVFLVPTNEYQIGQLNKEGYETFGIVAAIVIGTTALISSLGTHHFIPQLPKVGKELPKSIGAFATSITKTFSQKSFRNLFIGVTFFMLMQGIALTLQVYFATYFFAITSQQTGLLALSMVPAAIIAMFMTPVLAKGREKKTIASALILAHLLISNLSIIAHLAGILPSNESSMLVPILFVNTLVTTVIAIAMQIMFMSMVSDLIEDSQVETGQRMEGLYFAAFTFIRKSISGIGIFISGIMITVVGAANTLLTQSDMFNITIYYLPILTALQIMAFIFIRRYSLTRDQHEHNLAQLS